MKTRFNETNEAHNNACIWNVIYCLQTLGMKVKENYMKLVLILISAKPMLPIYGFVMTYGQGN